MRPIGTLGGHTSVGHGINNGGQVTGYAQLAGNTETHAFLTGANGYGMQDLGTLGGAVSLGLAVNALGQVVGFSYVTLSSGTPHAFLYSNGKMTDLNTLIDPQSSLALYVTLTDANAITDNGYILALGTDSRDPGVQQTFLLHTQASPVPIPGSGWLFLSGLAGMLCLGLRGPLFRPGASTFVP